MLNYLPGARLKFSLKSAIWIFFNTLFLVPFFLLPFMMPEAKRPEGCSAEHTYHFHPLFKGIRSTPEPLWYRCQPNFTDGEKLISKEKFICLVKVYVIPLSQGKCEIGVVCLYLGSPAWGKRISSNSGLPLWTQVSLFWLGSGITKLLKAQSRSFFGLSFI